jgi:hypothetical protein
MTRIAQPEAIRPVAHSLIATLPEPEDCHRVISQKISELAERGALDEGNFDVLDYWIDEQVALWIRHLDEEFRGRTRIAVRLRAAQRDYLAQERERLAVLRERHRVVRCVHAHWRDVLNGRTTEAPPATLDPEPRPASAVRWHDMRVPEPRPIPDRLPMHVREIYDVGEAESKDRGSTPAQYVPGPGGLS